MEEAIGGEIVANLLSPHLSWYFMEWVPWQIERCWKNYWNLEWHTVGESGFGGMSHWFRWVYLIVCFLNNMSIAVPWIKNWLYLYIYIRCQNRCGLTDICSSYHNRHKNHTTSQGLTKTLDDTRTVYYWFQIWFGWSVVGGNSQFNHFVLNLPFHCGMFSMVNYNH